MFVCVNVCLYLCLCLVVDSTIQIATRIRDKIFYEYIINETKSSVAFIQSTINSECSNSFRIRLVH